MGLSDKQMKDILNAYKRRRFEHEKTTRKRLEDAIKKLPEIKAINDTIATRSVDISKDIFKAPGNRTALLKQLQTELTTLRKQRLNLLISNNYPKDYLEQIYTCHKCKDTGFIESKRCSCLTQAIINKAYLQSNITEIINRENFDSFSLEYYSEDIDPVIGISPRDNAKSVFEYALKFTTDFNDTFNNLILYGQAGLGKTFLCNCIAKAVLDQGSTVVYLTSFQLFRLLETYRFHNDENIVTYNQIDDIYTCDLLIIDDLGSEIINQFTTSELFNTLNTRLLQKRPTVISTNLDPAGWSKHYSNRIVSRIFGNYTPLKLVGSDIRLKHLGH
jgi:DNA replication protein DnaC